MLANPDNISNRWKNYFSYVFILHGGVNFVWNGTRIKGQKTFANKPSNFRYILNKQRKCGRLVSTFSYLFSTSDTSTEWVAHCERFFADITCPNR